MPADGSLCWENTVNGTEAINGSEGSIVERIFERILLQAAALDAELNFSAFRAMDVAEVRSRVNHSKPKQLALITLAPSVIECNPKAVWDG